MPEKTMQAFADHGELAGRPGQRHPERGTAGLRDLAAAGIDFDDVVNLLEREGVEKFDASWAELVETVQMALDEAKQGKDSPGSGAEPNVTSDTVA
jgi:transaldolase